MTAKAKFPDLYLVKQQQNTERIKDVIEVLNQKLDDFELAQKVCRGQRVAITAGSRGIRDKPKILRELVATFKQLGLDPFIAPAMGSHGGATREGQTKVLKS